MKLTIREETASDFNRIDVIIQAAFVHDPNSDQLESQLVRRLRASSDYIPELTFVGEVDGQVVGYCMTTRASVISKIKTYPFLTLAPVAVHPDFQGKNIGSLLLEHTHEAAAKMQYPGIALLGHAVFYPKFGYLPSIEFEIKFPFDVPPENCLILMLDEEKMKSISGELKYPKSFFE